jgi:acetyltransferase-like isoleucine patch superfamily enzyme
MIHSKSVTIHPSADVSNKAKIGSNTIIWHQAQVREGAIIGQNCILGKDVYIDIDVTIGDNVKIQNAAHIFHGTALEAGVFVGPGVIFANDKFPRAINPDGTLKGADDWEVKDTFVSYGASVGAGAVIMPGITIGRFALIGAGAVLTHDVPDHGLVIGNPARQVGYVCSCATKLEMDKATNKFICPVCDERFRF